MAVSADGDVLDRAIEGSLYNSRDVWPRHGSCSSCGRRNGKTWSCTMHRIEFEMKGRSQRDFLRSAAMQFYTQDEVSSQQMLERTGCDGDAIIAHRISGSHVCAGIDVSSTRLMQNCITELMI
jgi:hypothetical protein